MMSETDLLVNVHDGLVTPGTDVAMITGCYKYFHYGCDGQDDRGWGCGYRTLQTVCSWIKYEQHKYIQSSSLQEVPSLSEIQAALVAMQDKPNTFLQSKQWIGSFEVCLCIDSFYNHSAAGKIHLKLLKNAKTVPCKIIHVQQGSDLGLYMEELYQHFIYFGSPIMMGGDTDNSSKGILGVCREPPALLVLDPHYYGETTTKEVLQQAGWVKWQLLDTFHQLSFYNLCLPQLKGS